MRSEKAKMVRLTIDGKEIETDEGRTILEAARTHGISIPTLCYHANLLSIGSCRICLVEVEGYGNPMVSCQTVVQEGMSVRTRTEKLFSMRRDYLKLILAYHPLDCPICDAGGECDLQDLVFEHRIEKADLTVERPKRVEGYATPLIKYFENRCVLCLRCIHACREISGRNVLDLVETGIDARMEPTDRKNCISCGECLSVCPVGALTEALSPIKSRPWQVERRLTTCPHCGFGCTFALDVYEGRFVTDVIQDESNQPNRGSLCVMGRFGYDFCNHEARLKAASSKGGPLRPKEAVSMAIARLSSLDREGKGIGFVVGSRATNEEVFLVKEIAGRFKKASLSTPASYHTGRVAEALRLRSIPPSYDYDRLLGADLVIIAGANLLSNNHVLGNRVRGACKLRGARIMVVDPAPTGLTAIADAHLRVSPGSDAALFNALSKRLLDEGKGRIDAMGDASAFKAAVEAATVEAAAEACALPVREIERACGLVSRAGHRAVIFGSAISASDEALEALLNFSVCSGTAGEGLLMPVARAANGVGAAAILESPVPPHELLGDREVKGLFFYEDDPCHYMAAASVAAMVGSREFVLVADALPSGVMDHADLVVPTGVFTEKEGTFFAGDGHVRRLSRVVKGASAASYGGFDFLRDLLAGLGGTVYREPGEVTARLKGEGLIRADHGRERLGTPGNGTRPGKSPAGPKAGKLRRGYVLVVRDLFSNHHLTGKDAFSEGVAAAYRRPGTPVSEDRLFVSPEDAAGLGLSEGDVVKVSSKGGSLEKPVSLMEGLKPGVLQYLAFSDRQGVLSLSESPVKWIEVEVEKG